jgi:hypothetical protein
MKIGGWRGSDIWLDISTWLILILVVVAIGGLYLLIQAGMSRLYPAVYSDATPDPETVAESVGISLYDGGDGRTTARIGLLLTATGDSPEWGQIASPDEAVNYLYYTHRRGRIDVTVMGIDQISPTLAIIDPDGSVLARDDNSDGDTKAELEADLPAQGHYTIRVSANAVDPNPRSLNYSLELATPDYYSPFEWPEVVDNLLNLVPLVIIALTLIFVLFGKLFGVSVKGPVERLRWIYLTLAADINGMTAPTADNQSQVVMVQEYRSEDVSSFEVDPDEDLDEEGLFDEDEADDEV